MYIKRAPEILPYIKMAADQNQRRGDYCSNGEAK